MGRGGGADIFRWTSDILRCMVILRRRKAGQSLCKPIPLRAMTIKKTAEGLIFHSDGEMERSLLAGVLKKAEGFGGLSELIHSRGKDGDGSTFYILNDEVEEFARVLSSLDGRLEDEEKEHGEKAGGVGLRTMTACLLSSCRELGGDF